MMPQQRFHAIDNMQVARVPLTKQSHSRLDASASMHSGGGCGETPERYGIGCGQPSDRHAPIAAIHGKGCGQYGGRCAPRRADEQHCVQIIACLYSRRKIRKHGIERQVLYMHADTSPRAYQRLQITHATARCREQQPARFY
jgi:hypothetical protein